MTLKPTSQPFSVQHMASRPEPVQVMHRPLRQALEGLEALPLMRKLEPRIMFDAAAVITAAEAMTAGDSLPEAPDADAPEHAGGTLPALDTGDGFRAEPAGGPELLHSAGTDGASRAVIFIDANVSDSAAILAAAGQNAEIVMLDPRSDGLAQIAAYLDGRTGIGAIHIVSHGQAGELHLGSARYDATALLDKAQDLARIGEALTPDGDVLLYGCNVAAGQTGQHFLQLFADLTRADVAGSTDDTGSAAMNGNWDLEQRVGFIEATPLQAPEMHGVLAPLNISVASLPIVSGGTNVGATAVWTNAGFIGSTAIDVRATVIAADVGTDIQFDTAGDDLWLRVTNGNATVRWEIFQSGTGQTVIAVGDPNFSIRDLDGNDFIVLTPPTPEVEAVAPNLTGLTSYTTETPTNLATHVGAGKLTVLGTVNQNGESNSMVTFSWSKVSSWEVTYTAVVGMGQRFYFHDGDGDFTFVAPNTTYMLGLDLDANNSTAAGTAYQTTFVESGAAVPVVDADVAITQHAALGTSLHSATVTLTNAQTADQLQVNGSTAPSGTVNGLSYTLTQSGGKITVHISGTGSLADYQAALRQITFSNPSDTVSSVDRLIEVSVTNATFGTTSNIALSTIHVTEVNDPVSAGSLANQASEDGNAVSLSAASAFSDPDGDPLTYSATGLPAGLSINPSTGVISGTLAAIASQGGAGGVHTVTVTASDGRGSSAQTTFTFTVANPAPLAMDDTLTANENGPAITGSVFTNNGAGADRDGGNDSDTLTITAAASSGGGSIALGAPVTLPSGALLTLLPNGSYSYDPNGAFESLDDGETATEIFTYMISDGQGGTDTATVTITIHGSNDAPTAGVLANRVSADGETVSIPAGAAFSDIDGDPLTFAVSGLPAGLSFDPATGLISGTLGSDASQGGAGGVYTVSVTADDGTTTTTRSFTLTVGNPAPIATDDAKATHENASQVSGGVLGNDRDGGNDGDPLAVHSAHDASGQPIPIGSEVTLPSGAKLTLHADGTYTYKPNGAFEWLDSDEQATDSFTYTVSDGQGGTDTATVTITIDGRNDAPQGPALVGRTSSDGESITLDLGALFSDPDGEALTFDVSGLPDGLTFDPATGVISGTITADASQNGLPVPNGSRYPIQVVVSDGDVSLIRSFFWTVTNPAPIAEDDRLTASEDGPMVIGNAFADNGNGIDRDGGADSDAITLTAVNGLAVLVGQPVNGSQGGSFVLGADGSISFDPAGDFEDLARGETRTTTITYTISDGQGGTDTATVMVTVEGANDTPIVVNPLDPTGPGDPATVIPAQSGLDGETITPLDVSTAFGDPDTSDQLTYSAIGLPPGLTISSVAGVISGTIDPSASLGGPYHVTVTATDPHGAHTSVPFTWAIGNPAPVAADDAFAAGEDGPAISGSVLADNGSGADHDTGPDSDALTVTDVNGDPALVGQPVPGSEGGSFTIGSDGTLTFDPAGDFDDLAQGETRITSLSYLVSDGQGGTDRATVTVTVTGSNDAPLVIDPLDPTRPGDPLTVVPGQTSHDGETITPLDLSSVFADPDTTDVLTFSATGLPAGLAIDPATGVITGTLDPNASQSGPYTVVVTATDPHGETAEVTFAWTITNPAPIAEDDGLVAAEDGPAITASVLDDNGSGPDHDTAPDSDPLSIAAVNGDPALVGTPVAGSHGGAFTIRADGTVTFDPVGAFEDLAEGETRTTTVSYTVSDGNGGTDTAVVTVTVTGANDTPIVVNPLDPTLPADPTGVIAAQSAADGETPAALDVSGVFRDPDASDLLTYGATGLPPGLTIDPVTGVIGGTIDHSASLTGPYTVTVTATDPHGASVAISFIYTVGNPAPVAEDDAFVLSEDGANLTASVFADNGNGHDHDTAPDSDPLSVHDVNGDPMLVGRPVAGSGGGSFVISADGTLSFEPGSDFQDLAAGETRITTITYTLSDGEGGTDTASVTVTVEGANDTPIVVDPLDPTRPGDPAAVIATQTAEDGEAITPLDVSTVFDDPDASDVLIYAATGLPPGLSIDPATGVISGTLDPAASLGGPYTVTVTATDPHGAATAISFTWSIGNPAPVAEDDSFVADEDGPTVAGSVLADNGSGTDHDSAFDSDMLHVAEVNGEPSLVGLPVAGSSGGNFTIASDGSLSFDPAGAFEGLALGETRTTSVTYTISDGQGGTDRATVSVTVTGANDAPRVIDPLDPVRPADPSTVVSTQSAEDGATITPLDLSLVFQDPDATDVLAFTATGLPPGLTIDPATGVISGTLDPSASQGGPYTVTVTARDQHGASASVTFAWTIANPAPVAEDDAATMAEDAAPLTGSVFADNGRGPDRDGASDSDPLTVSAINGDPTLVGRPVAGSGGGSFVIHSDGSYSFDPAGGFQDLAQGETRVTTVTYQVSDGEGGFDEATVSITVTGTNDGPVVVDASHPDGGADPRTVVPVQSGTDGKPIRPLDVSRVFGDPDASDTLTYSAKGLPKGLNIDPHTGVISGTIDKGASSHGPYHVTVTATDPHGAKTSVTFDWSVTNPTPIARDDALTVEEGGRLTGSVAGNDSDPDGDRLRYQVTEGPRHGTLRFAPDGSFVYVPAFGYQGTDTFSYVVRDPDGGWSRATVTITVEPVSAPLNVGQIGSDAGGIPMHDPGRMPDPLYADMGGIEVSYPNNVFIGFAVNDEFEKLETQFGMGEGSEALRYLLLDAIDPSIDNGNSIFDPLTGSADLLDALSGAGWGGGASWLDSEKEKEEAALTAGGDLQAASNAVERLSDRIARFDQAFDAEAIRLLRDLAKVA